MKFLLDVQSKKVAAKKAKFEQLVRGQLCTPLTNYKTWDGEFAIDNGAYSGLNRNAFFRLLDRNRDNMSRCIFVAVPDVVGSARRTSELFGMITQESSMTPWCEKWAFVVQDGHEDLHLNWYEMKHVFIGGTDNFKDSAAAYDIVKVAKALDIYVHVGRVNTIKRYRKYASLGADSCDGSGVCKYDHMLIDIANNVVDENQPTLFEEKRDESEA